MVVLRDIVIDPHPPAWIHPRDAPGQGLKQLREPGCCVIWFPVFSKPDQMYQDSLMTMTKLRLLCFILPG